MVSMKKIESPGERIGVRSFFPNLKRNGQLGA